MAEKNDAQAGHVGPRIEESLANLARRVDVNEDRMNTVRNHVDLIERSMLEKHKAVMDSVRKLESDIRMLRKKVNDADNHVARIVQRLDELAPKDRLLVLERYINMYSPIQYVTRDEVRDIVSKERGDRNGDN